LLSGRSNNSGKKLSLQEGSNLSLMIGIVAVFIRSAFYRKGDKIKSFIFLNTSSRF